MQKYLRVRGSRLAVIGTLACVIATSLAGFSLASNGFGGSSRSIPPPGPIFRFAANFHFGSELSTTVAPTNDGGGGAVIYQKSVDMTHVGVNVAYVTISATGDGHFGARTSLACLIDGKPCSPGGGGAASAPTGWVIMQRHKDYNNNYLTTTPYSGDGRGGAGDLHDNSIYYTWCAPVSQGMHNVQIKLGSLPVPGEPASIGAAVFLESAQYFVDGSWINDPTGACVPASPTIAASGTGPGNKQR